MANSPPLTVFLVALIALGAGCSSKNEIKTPPHPANQKISTATALETFETKQSFWSSARKTKFHGNRFYSLVFFTEAPSQAGHAKIKSSLAVHSALGKEIEFPQLPPDFSLIDFDITPKGQVIQLGFRELASSESEFGFPLKELSIFIDSQKAFTFADSKRTSALRYDQNSIPTLARHYDAEKTYFLTSSPLTSFAKLRVTNESIFISAVGTFGFKVFRFDYHGREISQAEILPQTVFNTILVDKEAPDIEITASNVITAVTTSSKDAPIFQKHFGISLDWAGPEYQLVLQSFNLSLSKRSSRLIKGQGDFFVSGIQTDENEFAVFGSSGGHGVRKALVAALRYDLTEAYRAEFTVVRESRLYAAAYFKGQLLVAGGTGSFQVQTGSVVEPDDSFVSTVSPDGSVKIIAKFGTERDDGVTSLLAVGEHVFLSGQQDGPITHTADTDPRLGYQKWFLGKLKSTKLH